MIAQDLLEGDACSLPLSKRSSTEGVGLAITLIGVAGNLSCVVVATPSLRAFAAELRRLSWRRRPQKTTSVSLKFKRPEGSEMDVELTGLEDERAVELIVRALEETLGA